MSPGIGWEILPSKCEFLSPRAPRRENSACNPAAVSSTTPYSGPWGCSKNLKKIGYRPKIAEMHMEEMSSVRALTLSSSQT